MNKNADLLVRLTMRAFHMASLVCFVLAVLIVGAACGLVYWIS